MQTQQTEQKRTVRWLGTFLLFGVIFAMLFVTNAWAVGTPSGTLISNQATINFNVGGVAQTAIDSVGNNAATGETTFVVDNRVDLTVAGGGNVGVVTDQEDANIVYTVTNTGNTTQGYSLDIVNGALNIPMGSVEIWVESNGTAGLQASGAGTLDTLYVAGANAGDLDPNGAPGADQMTVYIVADAPSTATNGNTDTYWLRATTLDAGTTTTTTATGGPDTNDFTTPVLDVVLADADADGDNNPGPIDDDLNGQHAAVGTFTISASNLSVTKTHQVISDPVNLTVNPKAIPGATVEYTITISNAAGAAQATDVVISDDLTALVTGATPLMAFSLDAYGAGNGLQISFDGGSTYTPLTNAADADAGDWSGTGANTVTVDCGSLNASDTAQVTFQLVIQ